MDNQINEAIDTALANIRVFFQEAATAIEALKPGQKLAATRLAETIALQHGINKASMYPILKTLFNVYPGVKITPGRYGGIEKLALTPTETTGE